MNRSILYILVMFCIFSLYSCYDSEYEYDNLFPEEYSVVFSLKETGQKEYTVYPSDSEQYDIVILKGGSKPEQTAKARIIFWSEEEISDHVELTNMNYKMIPSDTYSLSTEEVFFDSNERAKHIFITFDYDKLSNYISSNQGYVCILPMKLVSDDTVYSDNSNIILQINLGS